MNIFADTMKRLTRVVWILSLVSLLTDMASEMLYPVMPIYLRSIGFSVLLIGILEGVAEATAGLSKGYFGRLSDQTGRRMPFVQWGYGLSALSKPLMAVFVAPVWVFFVRTIDRLGKGLRTGARDAILSDEATPATKGTVFGFHRMMDTVGAVLGPLAALLYLQWHAQAYRTLFILALVPGLLAVCCSLLLRDRPGRIKERSGSVPFFSFLKYWKQSPVLYRRLVLGLLLFALVNSSDVFLLLRVKQAGLQDGQVIAMYIFYNLVYAVFAFPLGLLADKIGLKTVFLLGLVLFAVVYAAMAIVQNGYWFYLLFFLYGVYAAATEGISKAWISNITDSKDTATAIGSYAGFQSVCAVLASSLAGGVWFWWGAEAVFGMTGFAVTMIVAYMSFIPYRREGL